MRWLLLVILIVPALEIGVFLWAGGVIGPWWVVGLILLSGLIGISIAKQQGVETWNRARESMNYRQVPAEEIMDGICIIIGAIFLFTPGFITDIVGLLLVLPWTRSPFKIILQKWINRLINKNKNKGKIVYRKW